MSTTTTFYHDVFVTKEQHTLYLSHFRALCLAHPDTPTADLAARAEDPDLLRQHSEHAAHQQRQQRRQASTVVTFYHDVFVTKPQYELYLAYYASLLEQYYPEMDEQMLANFAEDPDNLREYGERVEAAREAERELERRVAYFAAGGE
ncbi:hypothetical protein LTR08_008639 [Meristemomyces frigidus]|nr:hypothetical protein LTR08_008639 [Meristemomyces frigidus]